METSLLKATINYQMTSNRFLEWMNYEAEERGWSQRDLAEKIGVSEGHISHLKRGRREPGMETYRGLSKAFHIPLETVLRIAGELPPVIKEDAQMERWREIFSELPPSDLDELYHLALFKLRQRQP